MRESANLFYDTLLSFAERRKFTMVNKRVLEVNVDDLNYGGVYSLIKNIIKFKPDSLQIDIATIEGFKSCNANKLIDLGCSIYDIWDRNNKKNKILKQFYIVKNLYSLLTHEQFNSIHIHADTANKLLISGIAAKLSGAHNIIFHSHASDVDGNHRKLKKLIHYICRYVLKYIGNKYVACSDLAANWMYPNINNKDIVVIKNGIDLEKFQFNDAIRDKVRKKLELTDEILLGHVGRFAYQKNHEFLLRLCKELDNSQLNYKLILIGNGVLENSIKEKAQKMKLKNIIFYGTTETPEELFQAMDVFVLPSHFEGLPIVGVEAQANGLPVVYSNRITREAKILDNCAFLDIYNGNMKPWIDTIIEYSNIGRLDGCKVLKKKKFDILNTSRDICRLYML